MKKIDTKAFLRQAGGVFLLLLGATDGIFGELRFSAGEVGLTLEEAIEETLRGNPELAAAREALNAAQARQRAARGDFFPSVSLSASLDRTEDGGSSSGWRPTVYGWGGTVRQTLFDGLKTQATVALREARVETAKANLAQVSARLLGEVRIAHADLLFAQENNELAKRILSRRKDNLDLVQLRFEGGREHKGSSLRIQAAQRQAVFEVSRAERAIGVAQTRLNRALGRCLSALTVATGTFQTAAPPPTPDFSLLAQNTPEVQSAVADLRAAQASRTLARSVFFPSIEATLQRQWSDDQWPLGGVPATRAGARVSVPLFAGGANRQGGRAAGSDLRQAEEEMKNIFAQSFLNLRSSWAAFQDALENLEVQQEFLGAAEVRAMIARGQYTSGLLSFENWDLIENDLIQAQKQELVSRQNAVESEALWEKAQGKGGVP